MSAASYTVPDAGTYSRAQAESLIWRHTHRDFRGYAAGVRTVLVNREGQGTCLVSLDGLTDDEIARKLGYAVRAEAKRIAAKAAKAGA